MGFGQNENASALKDSNKAVGQFWICRLPGNQAGGRAPKQRARRDEGDWGGGGYVGGNTHHEKRQRHRH